MEKYLKGKEIKLTARKVQNTGPTQNSFKQVWIVRYKRANSNYYRSYDCYGNCPQYQRIN